MAAPTRFAVIPGRSGILLGKDNKGLFKEGVVYECFPFNGEIVFKELGPYALPKEGVVPCEYSETRDILSKGLHLLTKEEYDSLP